LSGTFVICELRITNDDKDRILGIRRTGTEIFDDFNKKATASEIRLVDAGITFMTGSAESFLVAGVSSDARVKFRNVTANAVKINLLNLKCYAPGNNFIVQFRNIPLQ
jgi:hypothetical protein